MTYLEEDWEYAEAKDFVYLLADKMLDEHASRIEVIDKDKVLGNEDRHKHRTIRTHNKKWLHHGHGVPTDDDTRTVRCETDLTGQS